MIGRLVLIALIAVFASLAMGQTVPPGTSIATNSFTQGTATTTVAEQFRVTCGADSGGSLSADHITFCLPNSGTCYAPWFDVDNGSTAPTVTGHTLVEVDIATDDTAATVGNALQAAVDALTGVTCTDDDGGIVTCSLDDKGAATDATAGDTGWTVAVLTPGVSSSLAIAAASILPGVLGWRICNASANASTWLAIGQAYDTETDGLRIGPGVCYDCPACKGGLLGLTRVSAQAGSNVYTVVQFKQ